MKFISLVNLLNYEIRHQIWLKANQLYSPIILGKQQLAIMCPVQCLCVFSMLNISLGHILISALLVTNLFMHLLSSMILLFLTVPFYTKHVFKQGCGWRNQFLQVAVVCNVSMHICVCVCVCVFVCVCFGVSIDEWLQGISITR